MGASLVCQPANVQCANLANIFFILSLSPRLRRDLVCVERGVRTRQLLCSLSRSVVNIVSTLWVALAAVTRYHRIFSARTHRLSAGRLKMRDMKIRDGQKCRGGKCET